MCQMVFTHLMPDGVARIIEMRAMNQALHETGLRVVLRCGLQPY